MLRLPARPGRLLAEELAVDSRRGTQDLRVIRLHALVHHLVLVVRDVLHRAIDSPQFLRVHMRVFFCHAHLIFTLNCSAIVESEEISFCVVALIWYWLIGLLARITGRFELCIVWL